MFTPYIYALFDRDMDFRYACMVLMVLFQKAGEVSWASPILEEKALGELTRKVAGAVLALA